MGGTLELLRRCVFNTPERGYLELAYDLSISQQFGTNPSGNAEVHLPQVLNQFGQNLGRGAVGIPRAHHPPTQTKEFWNTPRTN